MDTQRTTFNEDQHLAWNHVIVLLTCFTKLKKAVTYLATAENITNELREKFAFGL